MKIKKKITRFVILYTLIGVFFVAVFAKLFYLQVICHGASDKKIISQLSLSSKISAPRGKIYDRNNVVLAGNREGYIIVIKKNQDELVALTVKNLAKLTDVSYEDILYTMREAQFSYSNPFVFSEDADASLVTKIKESPEKYPCAEILTQPIRRYFYPESLVHILGRCGIISREEYENSTGYSYNDYIGKQGVEKTFESVLRGKDGLRAKEKYTDRGMKKFFEEVDAIPGSDVILTIDLPLQQKTEEALKNIVSNTYGARGGAFVITDINSGEILASASNPSYNITEFNKDYTALSKDSDKPFFNRCTSGLYEPGSTFKMITAIAAMESNNLSPEETIKTRGKYEYFDQTFRCNIYRETGKTHGTIDVSRALGVSCNYFFYELGKRTGIEKIAEFASLFGLDKPTGIEIKEEATGTIATPENRKNRGGIWYGGDALQASIGQSDNLFTPLALTNYVAALGNGGKLYSAHILKGIKDTDGNVSYKAPQVLRTINLKQGTFDAIKKGMLDVTKNGTAKDVFGAFSIKVAGKTGTSQVSGRTNGLFLGYAPAENPEIAFCVVIEGGGTGNAAAKCAKNVLSYYFNVE